MNFNKNNLLHSEKFYFCNEVVFLQDNNSKSDNYTNHFEKMLRVITNNGFVFDVSTSFMKVINFSCGYNDDETKKNFFILNKKYTI